MEATPNKLIPRDYHQATSYARPRRQPVAKSPTQAKECGKAASIRVLAWEQATDGGEQKAILRLLVTMSEWSCHPMLADWRFNCIQYSAVMQL